MVLPMIVGSSIVATESLRSGWSGWSGACRERVVTHSHGSPWTREI